LCDRKGNEDFGSANFNQRLIATVLESGLYEHHVEQVCAAYRVKRDAMLAAADEHFSSLPGVTWVHPHGGLYVWMSLPPSIQTGFRSRLFEVAVKQEGVMYVPGELCYAGPVETVPRNQMRLSYGVQSPDGIREGMRRLAAAVRTTQRAASSRS
jgi:2-aminoadipate transaminase